MMRRIDALVTIPGTSPIFEGLHLGKPPSGTISPLQDYVVVALHGLIW